MHNYLCRHPKIVGGHKKELHYFDDPANNWDRPNYASYEAQFPVREPGQMRLDASPSYIYLPHCLDRLRTFSPDVRLILIFRDPIERACSHWSMATARGRETLTFDAAIRAESERIASCPPDDISYKAHAYLDRGFYGSQLARALEIFPRDQILCLAQETLKIDPSSALAQVSSHLGIAPFAPSEPLVAHKGLGLPIQMEPSTRSFICESLQNDIRLFSRLSGLDTENWSMFRDQKLAS